MAGIEIAQIPASIDYASLKHNEDMHSSLVQSQALDEGEKKTDLSRTQVANTEKSEMRPDDNGGGNSGGYAGDGGRHRNNNQEEKNADKVVIKGSSSSFDIKI
ncbi:MAG: hypothetical protein K5871_00715 [Lachnospiraceae bacterium]|nr:hypothetical protein [Lachnospiraceae bacterium]